MSISEDCLKLEDIADKEIFKCCSFDPDQTVKADSGKVRLTLVPQQIIYDIAEVRMYGNKKYPEGGVNNWKQVEPERYRDAAFRHFLAYLKDPKGVDEESGITHLKHLACNIAFLCEMEAAERPKKVSKRRIEDDHIDH